MESFVEIYSSAEPSEATMQPHLNGSDEASISPLNPRLGYTDITGYGEAGPEANKPGFDITACWPR